MFFVCISLSKCPMSAIRMRVFGAEKVVIFEIGAYECIRPCRYRRFECEAARTAQNGDLFYLPASRCGITYPSGIEDIAQ